MSASRSRSRSRSPMRSDSLETYEIDSASDDNDDDQLNDSKKFIINHFPNTWRYADVKKFIINRTNSKIVEDDIKFVKINKNQIRKSCIVEFISTHACQQAYKLLKAREHEKCEGRKITVYWKKDLKPTQQRTKPYQSKHNNTSTGKANRLDALPPSKAQVSHDTYGLSLEFLAELGVNLPLTNKVFVANLDRQVDEAALKEIFGNAGQVLDVFIMASKENRTRMAKVEFDHPLEAVQAISMLHNQELYGRPLVVKMDSCPNLHTKPLPKGLTSIGPGLGPNGAPMRAVRYAAEVQPLKELICSELVKLKELINSSNVNKLSDASVNMMNQTMTPLNINTMNAFNTPPTPVPNPFANAQSMQNLQMLQGLLQQNAGNTFSSLQAQSSGPGLIGLGQSYGASQSDWSAQSHLFQQQMLLNTQSESGGDNAQSFSDTSRRNYDDNRSSSLSKRSRDSEDNDRGVATVDTLVFSNLPSSVSLSALKGKMREIGEFKFAIMTEEGKAVVSFYRSDDAERCIKLFDRSKVDGQTIHVRYF